MLKLLFFTTLTYSSLFFANQNDYLVCIHGFMGAPWNMHFLEKNLEKDEWDVVNWKYPSRDYLIAEHAENLVQKLIDLTNQKPEQPIHFITHSMGGLVLLSALNHPLCPQEAKRGKVVLIAPPLKGSCFGRRLNDFFLTRWLAKDYSGHELMTESDFDHLGTFPDSLEALLVIAGSLGFNPFLHEDNDGTLTLSETLLPTPHDHITVKRGHKTIIFSKKVCNLARQFFRKKS